MNREWRCSDRDNLAARALLEPLQSLAQMQRRADLLSVQIAGLRQRLTRDFPLERHADAHRPLAATILLAIEEPALTALAEDIVVGLGCDVAHADRGAFDGVIDAVMLDAVLANDEALARIGAARRWSPRVIVATLLPEGRGRQRLRDAGAASVIRLPLLPSELSACLHALLD